MADPILSPSAGVGPAGGGWSGPLARLRAPSGRRVRPTRRGRPAAKVKYAV